MPVVVVARVMGSRRCDDVDAAPARDLRQEQDVAAAISGHGVDDAAQAEGLRRGKLGDGLVDVVQLEVGKELDGASAVDDEVLVGIDDAQLVRADVSEDGAGKAHA